MAIFNSYVSLPEGKRVDVGFSATSEAFSPTTTNPYAVQKEGYCVLDVKCVVCLGDPKHCPQDRYLACRLQQQYCTTRSLSSSLPTMLHECYHSSDFYDFLCWGFWRL